MYVRPISTRLLRGTLTPEIRAMVPLPLPLLVAWIGADDENPPVTADDLALLAPRLDRRSDLHCSLSADTGWTSSVTGTVTHRRPSGVSFTRARRRIRPERDRE